MINNNTFKQLYNTVNPERIDELILNASANQVESILNKDKISWKDFLVLLSEPASKYLEQMAQKSHQITIQRFGKNMQLYVPLYLSNNCSNKCKYCGFNQDIDFKRKFLSIEEFKQELDVLINKGFKNILLVSGEDKKNVNLDYLKKITKLALEKTPYVSLEIYPLTKEEYTELKDLGINGVTLYQETYDKDTYHEIHEGTKKDFYARLDTVDEICELGYRNIGIGALFGLFNWRIEAGYAGLHAEYLSKKYWQSKVSVSVPRLKKVPSNFKIKNSISDKNLVQFICAMRIFLNDAGIILSTREDAIFRDNVFELGITQMSAESSTMPGGYLNNNELEQFKVYDSRSAEEVSRLIEKKGYCPVWKDWDRVFNFKKNA